MVVVRNVKTNGSLVSESKRFTPDAFKQYGLAMSLDGLKSKVPNVTANQGSALKLVKITEFNNNYPPDKPGKTYWDIFQSGYVGEKWDNGEYICRVLEKHPYSSQTFLPLGVDKDVDAYVVICAPDKDGEPDWEKTEMFVAKGGEAVTYNAGVWHAPMVVLNQTIDFCVLGNQNGIPEDECIEICYEPGFKLKL